ncbi:hypothetical protein GCM10022281_10650 [Sphingomonas rosea]|uniref:Excalibur calcium-binding domain-containing protein n=1 Tax=Sphingomonas rosea TaxID=335605 RepID=A0ABP7TZN6_9SPHN
MRNLVIPALVFLPTLAGIAHAAQDARPWDYPPRAQQARALTAREKSVSYAGCREVRRLGLAPLRRGEPGYRPWMDGDNDGLACEPVRR